MNKKIILCFVFLFLSVTMVSATIEDIIEIDLKWGLCEGQELNGSSCDMWWLTFKEAMGIEDDVEEMNMTIIKRDYYNKSQVEALFFNQSFIREFYMMKFDAEELIGNITEKRIENISTNDTITRADLNQFGLDLEGRIMLNDEYEPSSNAGISDSTWVIIGLVVIGLIGFWYMNNKNNKPQHKETVEQVEDSDDDDSVMNTAMKLIKEGSKKANKKKK